MSMHSAKESQPRRRRKRPLTRDAYINGPLPIETELRLLFDQQAELNIFDIGSCEGEDAIRYARLFPHAHVFAVEPLPANVARIQASLLQHDVQNVRVLPLALSDTRGVAPMWVSSGRPGDADDAADWDYGNKSSSLLEPFRVLEIHPWLRFGSLLQVETATLSEVCSAENVPQVDFIHLDVQGAELKVLRGAEPLLGSLSAIWLEVEQVPLYRGQPLKTDVERYLEARGFWKLFDTVNEVSGDELWLGRHVARDVFRTRTAGIAHSSLTAIARRVRNAVERHSTQ